MPRVTGIGGIFFKAGDPEALRAWYARHLEIDLQPWGGAAFAWKDEPLGTDGGATVRSVFAEDSNCCPKPFMINFRVENFDAVLAALLAEGCQVDDRTEVSEMDAFGWMTDPGGNRVRLWQPPGGQLPG